MRESNLEIVERWWEAFQELLDSGAPVRPAMEPFFDPDCDYYPAKKFPEARPCHGIDAIAAFVAPYRDTWERVRMKPVKVTATGDDRVLSQCVLSGAGLGSGVELGGDVFICFWLRNGRIFRQEDHLTEVGARRALGVLDDGPG